VIALWVVVRKFGPEALALLLELARAVNAGESAQKIALRAQKLAHVRAFELAAEKARQ